MSFQLFTRLDKKISPPITDQPLPYFVAFIVLITATLWSASRFNQRKPSFPIFGDEEGTLASAKQRWGFDSVNLIREGYLKVLTPWIHYKLPS